MAHHYSPRFLLAVEDGGSGSDIAAEGDEENKYWFPPLDYEVYYPIIWTLLGLLLLILQIFFCCVVGWIAFCWLYCKKRQEIGRENRQRVTANDGAMMNTYTRQEPPPGNPTATDGPEAVLTQPVSTGRQAVDRMENSLRQTEEDIDEPVVLVEREREEQQDMGPEQQNLPGPDESTTTRPTLQQHQYPADTVPTRSIESSHDEGASPLEKKTEPPVTNKRYSDYSETNSLVKDQLAKRSFSADELARFPYSVETSDSRVLEKQISQETVPGVHGPRVQGDYYNSLKHKQLDAARQEFEI